MSDVEHPIIEITVRGAQGAGKSTIVAAIREMLAEADIAAAVVGNEEPATALSMIERLHNLRGGPRVVIKTRQSGEDPPELSEIERAVWAAEFVRARRVTATAT
jgi:Mg-chelatase subunit ChlI